VTKSIDKDQSMNSMISSTCSSIRNIAIKELSKNNNYGWLLKDRSPFSNELNNLCYGSG